jgi:peptidoglycan/LPS O-acetylase OafA/YrhL
MTRSDALDRIINLDLVRAAAIVTVVIFHTVQLMGVSHPITQLTNVGEYGVDLFFVLSGFLIGRLYWIEEKTYQSVNLFRFISRRILRIIFLYVVALCLSFLAVFIERQQLFDFRYLIFTQNYHAKIPFFLVSWSLCIEVHFYILLPFLLLLIHKLRPVHRAIVLSSTALIPISLRLALVE